MIETNMAEAPQPAEERVEVVDGVELWAPVGRLGGHLSFSVGSGSARDGRVLSLQLRPEGIEVRYQPPGSRPALTCLIPFANVRVIVLREES